MIEIKLFTMCVCLSCFHVGQLGNGLQVDNGNPESRAQNKKSQFKLFDFNYANNFSEVNCGSSVPYTGAGSLLDHGAQAEIGKQYFPQSTSGHAPRITNKLGFQNSTLPIKMVLKASLILITALAVLFRLYQCFLVLAQKQTTSSRRLASEEQCDVVTLDIQPTAQESAQQPQPTVMRKFVRRMGQPFSARAVIVSFTVIGMIAGMIAGIIDGMIMDEINAGYGAMVGAGAGAAIGLVTGLTDQAFELLRRRRHVRQSRGRGNQESVSQSEYESVSQAECPKSESAQESESRRNLEQ